MFITIFCPRCSKTTQVEYQESDVISKKQTTNNVPVPIIGQSISGTVKLSLAHNDHILILDVDNNGSVRDLSVITRLDASIQNYLAALTNNVLRLKESDQSYSILIVSNSLPWFDILSYLSSQIIINNTNLKTGFTFINDENKAELIYRNLFLTLISPDEFKESKKAYNAIILEFDSDNLDYTKKLFSKSLNACLDDGIVKLSLTKFDDSKEYQIKIGNVIFDNQLDSNNHRIGIIENSSKENMIVSLNTLFDELLEVTS